MPFEDGNSERRFWEDERPKSLDEIVGAMSETVFSKYSYKEDLVISNGVSIFDVVQDKFKEFVQRCRHRAVNPADERRWIDKNIRQGERKVYKRAEPNDSIDDENFDSKILARETAVQTNLEKYEIIRKVLDGYAERNRRVIELALFVEIGYEETAKQCAVSEGNVRKIVCDFKKDCRNFGLKTSANKGEGENIRGGKDEK